MAWRRVRLTRIALTLATGMLLGVLANPAPGPRPASTKQAPVRPTAQEPNPLLVTARVGHFGHDPRPVAPTYRVVVSSLIAPRVSFEAIRLHRPPQQITLIVVAPEAHFRAVLVPAGTDLAPFATVSSAVKRTHALAGTNGVAWALPAQNPMLIRDSRIVAASHGAIPTERHPRTGICLTGDGSTLFVTVDGRRATSVGMTLREFAAFLLSMGAVWAVNLDGGASTTIVVRGRVANHPSDPYGERRVPTAVVLLPSAHPGSFHLASQLHQLDPRVVLAALQSRRSTR